MFPSNHYDKRQMAYERIRSQQDKKIDDVVNWITMIFMALSIGGGVGLQANVRSGWGPFVGWGLFAAGGLLLLTMFAGVPVTMDGRWRIKFWRMQLHDDP